MRRRCQEVNKNICQDLSGLHKRSKDLRFVKVLDKTTCTYPLFYHKANIANIKNF